MMEQKFDSTTAYKCAECEEVNEEAGPPLYSCNGCGAVFNKEQGEGRYGTQCPDCHKFGAKLADRSCLECEMGEVEEVSVVSCDDCDTLIEADEWKQHREEEHGTVECPDCGEDVLLDEMETHQLDTHSESPTEIAPTNEMMVQPSGSTPAETPEEPTVAGTRQLPPSEEAVKELVFIMPPTEAEHASKRYYLKRALHWDAFSVCVGPVNVVQSQPNSRVRVECAHGVKKDLPLAQLGRLA